MTDGDDCDCGKESCFWCAPKAEDERRGGGTPPRFDILHGDVLNVLRGFRDSSLDACMCDPPYGLSFMGKSWDYAVPSVETWAEILRVLKPGAPLVAFGGSRTYHRLACGIEDAGFELRDCLMWLHGKGFPKSQNIGLAIDKSAGATREVEGTRVLTGNAAMSTKEKGGTYGVQVGSIPPKRVNVTAPATDLAQAWDGYGTALKPAYEPIVLARKPLDGTMAANVARWGVGGLWIEACRVDWKGKPSGYSKSGTRASENVAMSGANYARDPKPDAQGRWPANLILDEESGVLLDASVAPTTSRAFPENAPVERAGVGVGSFKMRTAGGYSDSGGPSRFFYCAKVSTKEREAGCEGLPRRSAGAVTNREEDTDGLESPAAGAGRVGGARNFHPTLKPLSLTTWLGRMIRPPSPGSILVPFSGAGSEMIGAALAGWPMVIGIEQDAEHIQIARARLAHWLEARTRQLSLVD